MEKKMEETFRFVMCVHNDGYEDDLKVRMVYRVLPDEVAAQSNYLRIIDESGKDYLYPANAFVLVDVFPETNVTLSSFDFWDNPLDDEDWNYA